MLLKERRFSFKLAKNDISIHYVIVRNIKNKKERMVSVFVFFSQNKLIQF